MKLRKIAAVLLLAAIIAVTSASLLNAVSAEDSDDAPVGFVSQSFIEADNLSDYSEKLSSLTDEDIVPAIMWDVSEEEAKNLNLYDKVMERIDAGLDFLFAPDIDCKLTDIKSELVTYDDKMYREIVTSVDNIAISSSCKFNYNGIDYYYSEGASTVGTDTIDLYGMQVSYMTYGSEESGGTFLCFSNGTHNFAISVNSALTLEQIESLPEGMFNPVALSIKDIMNGDYPDRYCSTTETETINIDDPKESYVDCFAELETVK